MVRQPDVISSPASISRVALHPDLPNTINCIRILNATHPEMITSPTFNLKAFNKLFISSELWQSLRIFHHLQMTSFQHHFKICLLWLLNLFCFFFQDITDNQAVSDPAFYSLIILYALVIFGSVVGNVLVITAVLKSPKMRKVSESDNSPAR